MITQRVLSPNYLGVGLSIAMGLTAGLGWSLEAQAQNLNEQTQITITAPLEVTPPRPDIPSQAAQQPRISISCPPSPEQIKLADDKIRAMPPKEKEAFLTRLHIKVKPDERTGAQSFVSQNAPEKKVCEIVKASLAPPGPILNAPNGQPTKVKVSFVGNPTYESNILKSGNNSSHGGSAGFGSSALLTTAGVRPLDLIALSVTEGSSRYSRFFSQNTDAINSYIAYSAFLHADGYTQDGKFISYVDPDKPSVRVPEQNLATIDTLAFGFQNQTSFAPTFHKEKINFFTPQFTLSSQNINLDDPAHLDCALNLHAFCHFANLSLTVGQSFSDVTTQQNFNVAGSAALGWRIDGEWSLALQGTATGKEYENFVGGRRDLQLQAGPILSYAPTTKFVIQGSDYASVSFTLPVTYYKNFSTVSAAAWSGLVIQPTLTVSFNYTASAAMPLK
jgi:hypothetical protein